MGEPQPENSQRRIAICSACFLTLVNSKQVMKFNLKPRGGAAIHLVPVDRTMMKKYKKYSGKVL